ncbi:MAG: cytochrome c oxidase subunit II, partial [Spirochaetota bacterium]
WYGLTGYQFLRRVPQGALQVSVHSKQYAWSFEYPGGKIYPSLVVPSGSDVRVNITSDDVLHGFYIPALRIQVDAVPGMTTRAWFHAKDLGSYDILCTVYCGTAHSAMLAKLYVLSPAQYQRWKAGDEIELDGASLPLVKPEGPDLLASLGCLNCHSVDGSKGVGPTFKGLYMSEVTVMAKGVKKTLMVDDAYLASSIKDPHSNIVAGFEDLMPSLDAASRAEDVDELLDAIKALR